jgi:hypothetical protein
MRGSVGLNCALIYDAMFFQLSVFALVFAFETSPMAQAQFSIDRPKIVIDVVELEGTRLPKADQEQLVTSLKQREWAEGSDWEADVTNMVVSAERWSDRENEGYLGGSFSVGWKPLRREPGLLHILVTVHVNEGKQKDWKRLRFATLGSTRGHRLSFPMTYGS